MTSQKDNIQNKYIYKKDNKYCIYKMLNGRQKYFGRFKTLDEAIEYREFLIAHDWNLQYKKRCPPGSSICSCDKKSNKYIHKTGKKYGVFKSIKCKLVYFGVFNTIEDARQYRNFLMDHNWDIKYRLVNSQNHNVPQYIRKNKHTYSIHKYIEGKTVYFGTFDTLEEARKHRDFLINHHWDTKYVRWAPRKYNLPRYVYYNPYADNYYIAKKVGDTQFRFGTYKTRDEAIHEKKFYESINWDLDLLDLY